MQSILEAIHFTIELFIECGVKKTVAWEVETVEGAKTLTVSYDGNQVTYQVENGRLHTASKENAPNQVVDFVKGL